MDASLNIVKQGKGRNKCHNFEVRITTKGYIFCKTGIKMIKIKDKE